MTVTSNDSQCIHPIMFLDIKVLYKLLMLEMIFSRNIDAMWDSGTPKYLSYLVSQEIIANHNHNLDYEWCYTCILYA